MPFEDWRSKLAKAVRTVKDSTGEIYNTAKINVDLGKEQDHLNKLYYEIGKKVHEIYQYGGSLGKFFDEKYLEIKEVEERIEELQKKMEEVKKVRVCTECGKEVEKGAKFCPKCGASMSNVPAKDKEEVAQSSEKPIEVENNDASKPKNETKICPTCKAENGMDDKFCLSCGRALF